MWYTTGILTGLNTLSSKPNKVVLALLIDTLPPLTLLILNRAYVSQGAWHHMSKDRFFLPYSWGKNIP